MLSSLTKTITATALMQLYDDGLFGLHDPVNNYLNFFVVHPKYHNTDITFHMLLTHTSGIQDNFAVMPYYQGDSPIPLGQYLEDYLTPGGIYYDPNANFTAFEPGRSYSYSNIGLALVGCLVETISGIELEEYCQQNIFPLLAMDESSYFLKNLDQDHIAMPYKWNGSGYDPYGHYGYSDYPSGQLRTSATQLMNFLSTFMENRYPDRLPYSGGGQGGSSQGKMNGYSPPGNFEKVVNPPKRSTRILKSETVKMMLTPQIPSINPNMGLVWNFSNYGGYAWVGINGGDKGVATTMWYYQEEDIGIVGLTNGESAFYDIFDAMFEYALNYD
jgi:CubicO group peptidase (beta-lactamase class C family)